jgi:hypothetical protein
VIAGCGGGSGCDVDSELLGSRDFIFGTTIDPTTLTQEDSIRLYESIFTTRDEAYAIENQGDLDTFNQTLTESEQVLLDDLDTYTYFFIRSPGCPDYFEYATHNYNYVIDMLTITVDHIHFSGVSCKKSIEELFLVFKANKKS